MTPSQPYLIRSRPSAIARGFAKLLAWAGFSALAVTVTPNVQGYSLEPGSPRWSSGTVTFVLSLGGTRTLSDGSTSFDAAAIGALGTWNQYMGSLQLNIVTNDSSPVSQGDGVNSVAFASSFFGDSFGSNTLGITGYSYGNGRMTEANTLLNNRYSWDSYRGALRSAMDIRRVLIHEIGHALGLDHPDQHGQNVAAVMNSIVSNTDTAVTDDINGIQFIYGARNGGGSTPTPTPTPRPSATPTPTPNPTATPAFRTVAISGGAQLLHTGQTATFTVSVSSASSSPLSVRYFAGGSARQNMYSLSGTPGQVTIPAGATSATFSLTATSGRRRAKTVTIFLISGSNYAISGSRSASVSIIR